jgi:poly-beta-1,6-N-acetyl-D-glucosamine synthase
MIMENDLIDKKILVSVGVFCYNEEKNIAEVLDAILKSTTKRVEIMEILVVSSGSYDLTDEIVESYQAKDTRIKLISELHRNGKASAINVFMRQAAGEVLIVLSGDVRVGEHAIEQISLPFLDREVGMVGAHPIPINANLSYVGKEMKLMWELHHEVSLIKPKCGEMVAFRKVINRLPKKSAVDEATLEVLLKMIGFKVIYAPMAVVYNKVPLSIGEFIKQRRRVAAGHMWLKDKYQYGVSTFETDRVSRVIVNYLINNPREWKVVVTLIMLELAARMAGWIDYRILGINPYVWGMVRR